MDQASELLIYKGHIYSTKQDWCAPEILLKKYSFSIKGIIILDSRITTFITSL